MPDSFKSWNHPIFYSWMNETRNTKQRGIGVVAAATAPWSTSPTPLSSLPYPIRRGNKINRGHLTNYSIISLELNGLAISSTGSSSSSSASIPKRLALWFSAFRHSKSITSSSNRNQPRTKQQQHHNSKPPVVEAVTRIGNHLFWNQNGPPKNKIVGTQGAVPTDFSVGATCQLLLWRHVLFYNV